MQRQFCKPPADAALAAKGASKARKAKKRSGMSGPDFRAFESPSGFQVINFIIEYLQNLIEMQPLTQASGQIGQGRCRGSYSGRLTLYLLYFSSDRR